LKLNHFFLLLAYVNFLWRPVALNAPNPALGLTDLSLSSNTAEIVTSEFLSTPGKALIS